jgi:CheY-like chemotaxis protein
MRLVRLVCWNPTLAEERARLLARRGWKVDASPLRPSGLIGHMRKLAPSAIVLDLDRLPSQGRILATLLRGSPSTRHIPLVFAGGEAEKTERVREELPDAIFTSWEHIHAAVDRALRDTPVNPVRATPYMARYAGAALPRKLGIEQGSVVALLGAPDGFEDLLDGAEASIENAVARHTRMVLWFVHSRRELDSEMPYLAARLPAGCGFWVIHPKVSGRYAVDFNQKDVRAAGNAAGLVDHKLCAVDADWAGLKMGPPRSKR